MAFKRAKIDCFGKPYRHVGWHPNDRPKFVKKPLAELEAELASVGREPTFDETGWFTGSVKKKENPVATLTEGQQLPDHMLDANQFITEVRDAPSLVTPMLMSGKQFGKTIAFKENPARFGNPCGEIFMTPQEQDADYKRENVMEDIQAQSRAHRQGPAGQTYVFNGKGFDVAKPEQMTVMGHHLYSGPATVVEVFTDDTYGDVEVKVKQTRCLMDVEVRFGPVKTRLSDLFDSGHWLEAQFDQRDIKGYGMRKTRVYLTDGTDRYRVYSIDWRDLQSNGKQFGQYDLGANFPTKINLLRTHSSARYPKPVIQKVVVEKVVERDPFEVLAERYPRGEKKPYTWDTMVGNRTLRERFEDHLGNR